MLMLGTLTGGLAYNRQLALTAGAREGVRYAATLPGAGTVAWANEVAAITMIAANGELDPGEEGRYICVAHIGTGPTPFKQEYGTPPSGPAPPDCFADGLAGPRPRVQVVVQRTSTLEAMVFSQNLTLDFNAVAKYEG
jgi:hypothetical protein